jgi:hypothetical protein
VDINQREEDKEDVAARKNNAQGIFDDITFVKNLI